MNEGESWCQFESTIIEPSALSYEINQLIFHDPIIQSLFGTDFIKGNVKGMTGGYDLEKKGDARFISELVYLIKSNCTSGVGTEANVCDMLLSNQSDYLVAYKKVKKYLELISVTFDCPKNLDVAEAKKPFDKENLRGMILLLDLISNNLNSENLNSLLQIKNLDHLESPKEILITPRRITGGAPIEFITCDAFLLCVLHAEPIDTMYFFFSNPFFKSTLQKGFPLFLQTAINNVLHKMNPFLSAGGPSDTNSRSSCLAELLRYVL